mmetsp:Transcript_83681/g.194610  ORF Transcript_83681/g.194610 Transcript_83681/m.194610 type:complete len:650 (-) Transcript_83681:112-2061(-)
MEEAANPQAPKPGGGATEQAKAAPGPTVPGQVPELGEDGLKSASDVFMPLEMLPGQEDASELSMSQDQEATQEVVRVPSSKRASGHQDWNKTGSMLAMKGNTTEFGFSWLINPHVWWRHPLARILVVWLILLLDMWLFGEDPVNDSHVEANLSGAGHLYNFLLDWPAAAGLCILRFVLVALSIVFGCYVGRQWIHHRLFRDRLKLEMFSECNGTWLVMGLSSTFTLLVGCMLYNLFLASSPAEQITGATGMEMRTFCKATQICSVTADLVAILMVTDAVLQDRTYYPRWAPWLKWLWTDSCRGCVRVVVVWIIFSLGVSLTVWGILNTGKDATDFRWDDRRIGGLTEVARALMMSCVVFCDLFTVVQDWGFPSFQQPVDLPLEEQVMIAGTWVREINCNCLTRCARACLCLPRCLMACGRRCWERCCPTCCRWPKCCRCRCSLSEVLPDLSFLHVRITGSWLTYGPLFFVMCIDLFCTRTQLIYAPELYGQYVEPEEQRIWTILDQAFLLKAYDDGYLREGMEDLLTFEARRNVSTGEALSESAATDVLLNARYLGSNLKYLTAAPGVLMMFLFIALVWAANKRRTLLVSMAKLVGSAASVLGNATRTVGSTIAGIRSVPGSPAAPTQDSAPPQAQDKHEPKALERMVH